MFFILIVFKICWSSRFNNLRFYHNHLIKTPILFHIYLSSLLSHRNGSVFKMYIWISVFRRKKQFENEIFGWGYNKQKPSLIFFGTTCEYFEGALRSAKSTTPKSDLFFCKLWGTHLPERDPVDEFSGTFEKSRFSCFQKV